MKKLCLLLAGLLALSACSTQTLFDNLGPKDKGSKKIARDVSFADPDRLKLDIYAPKEIKDKAPVLVFIHGGGWNNGNKDGYDFVGRAFAAKGYVTVIPNYRLVPEVKFPTFLEDGAAAIKWIDENISQYGGDAEEIYLVGHSAGGYNAIMLAIAPSYLAAKGLGEDTIDGAAGIAGPYDFFPYDVPSTIEAFGHIQDPSKTQPIALYKEGAPPLLLVTGTDDKVVYPRNIRAMQKIADEKGLELETKFYEGLDHIEPAMALSVTFRKKAPVLEDITSFFDRLGEAN